MAPDEPCDRGVIHFAVGGDDSAAHVIPTRLLNSFCRGTLRDRAVRRRRAPASRSALAAATAVRFSASHDHVHGHTTERCSRGGWSRIALDHPQEEVARQPPGLGAQVPEPPAPWAGVSLFGRTGFSKGRRRSVASGRARPPGGSAVGVAGPMPVRSSSVEAGVRGGHGLLGAPGLGVAQDELAAVLGRPSPGRPPCGGASRRMTMSARSRPIAKRRSRRREEKRGLRNVTSPLGVGPLRVQSCHRNRFLFPVPGRSRPRCR